jgi:hypothetical protein
MKPNVNNIQDLHFASCQVLLDWFDNPPKDRREMMAFELFSEVNQMLYAICINLNDINQKNNSV